MIQLRYAIRDMGKKKFHYTVLLLESVLAFLLIGIVLSVSFDMYTSKSKYDKTLNGKQVYLLRDESTTEEIDNILQNKKVTQKMAQLYDVITAKNNTYTAAPTTAWDKPVETLDNDFKIPHTNGYYALVTDSNFFDFFGISCSKGRIFTENDYNSEDTSETPVILGYDYFKYIRLNQTFKEDGVTFKAVGFLKKGASFFDPGRGSNFYNLDKYIIKPMQKNIFVKNKDAPSFDEVLTHTFIITDKPENLQQIQVQSSRLGLYTYGYRSFSEQINYIMSDFHIQLKLTAMLLFVVLIFTILGIVSSIMQFIEKSTKEFAIHLLCGATVGTVLMRISFQLVFMILLSNVVNFIIFGRSITTFMTFIISIIIFALILIVSTSKFRNMELNDILRRYE